MTFLVRITLSLLSFSVSAHADVAFCFDFFENQTLIDARNDPLYEQLKRQVFRNDPKLVDEFEALPDWAQIDFLDDAYRRYTVNGERGFLDVCR